MFDIVTIGSATMDFFIETDSANIVSVFSKDRNTEFMSYPYGSKLEINEFKVAPGGGGINTALNFANLGLKTSAIFKMGTDFTAESIKEKISASTIDTSNLVEAKKEHTGFSVILLSFQGDRTVLAHRGANANISAADINFENLKNTKWLYVAPLSGNSNRVLDKLATFAEENKINLSINLGTTCIKKGVKYLEKILSTAKIALLNKEEAIMVTGIQVRPDSTKEKFSKEIIHPDIIAMLEKMKSLGSKVIVITDGKHGAYAYDGQQYYACPEFPAKVVSTLGAGDAFASTFTATINQYGIDVEKALKYASVNSASVVTNFGAQEGFLTFEEIEKRLSENLDFKVTVIKK